MADKDLKTADDKVIEGGVQGDRVQEVGVLEGCHTLDVGFQCIDSWNKEVLPFL